MYLPVGFFGQACENYYSIQKNYATVSHSNSYVSIFGWATFWAIFSPTHLVTLYEIEKVGHSVSDGM
jgi:hypothetical protein